MNSRDTGDFESAVRMSEFGAANMQVLQNFPKALDGFAILEADIAALETTGARRVSAAGTRSDGTVDKLTAKNALYQLVRRVARTAQTIKKAEPDFANKFKLGRNKMSSHELLDLAAAFQINYAAVAAKFAEYGLPATMPDLLGERIAAFEAARTEQIAGAGEKLAATAQIRHAIKRLNQIRRMLRIVVTNIYLDNPAKLAEWKSACHVKRRAAPPKSAAPTN